MLLVFGEKYILAFVVMLRNWIMLCLSYEFFGSGKFIKKLVGENNFSFFFIDKFMN